MVTTTPNSSDLQTSNASNVEDFIWNALEMDSLNKEMSSEKFAPTNQILMGTERTVNACNQCSNSLTTSGCGGC